MHEAGLIERYRSMWWRAIGASPEGIAMMRWTICRYFGSRAGRKKWAAEAARKTAYR
jgi:hypothetical protein